MPRLMTVTMHMPFVAMTVVMVMIVSVIATMSMFVVSMLMMVMSVTIRMGMSVFESVNVRQFDHSPVLHVGEDGTFIVGTTAGGHILYYLQFFDPQFVSGQPFEIGTAACAAAVGLISQLSAAIFAAGASRRFDDL